MPIIIDSATETTAHFGKPLRNQVLERDLQRFRKTAEVFGPYLDACRMAAHLGAHTIPVTSWQPGTDQRFRQMLIPMDPCPSAVSQLPLQVAQASIHVPLPLSLVREIEALWKPGRAAELAEAVFRPAEVQAAFRRAIPYLLRQAEDGDEEAAFALLEYDPASFFDDLGPRLFEPEVAGLQPGMTITDSEARGRVWEKAYEVLLRLSAGESDDIRDAGHLKNYVRKSVRNAIADEARASRAQKRGGETQLVSLDSPIDESSADSLWTLHEVLEDSAVHLESHVVATDFTAHLRRGLESTERQILDLLLDNPGIKNVEIGELLEMPESTVRYRRGKIKEKAQRLDS